MFSYWAKPADTADLAKILNEHIAGLVADHPRRFTGLGTLPMQHADLSIRELERCHKSLALAGIHIGSHVNGWNLDDERVFPILEAAANLGSAVFVHPFGSIRIALGSDYPFPLGERHPGKMIEEMELDNNTRSNLLADAALDWLALKRKDFE